MSLRRLWAPSRHSLRDHLTTAMQTKSTFANVAFADAEPPRGRGTLFFCITEDSSIAVIHRREIRQDSIRAF